MVSLDLYWIPLFAVGLGVVVLLGSFIMSTLFRHVPRTRVPLFSTIGSYAPESYVFVYGLSVLATLLSLLVCIQFLQVEADCENRNGHLSGSEASHFKDAVQVFNIASVFFGNGAAFCLGALANVHYKSEPKVHLAFASVWFISILLYMVFHALIPVGLFLCCHDSLNLGILVTRLFTTLSGILCLSTFSLCYASGMRGSIADFDPIGDDPKGPENTSRAEEDSVKGPRIILNGGDVEEEPLIEEFTPRVRPYPRQLVFGALFQYSAITSVGVYFLTFYWSLRGAKLVSD